MRIAALTLLAVVFPRVIWAVTATVPNDYATIQQAIDSAADTIQVRSGYYAERLFISTDVVLLPVSLASPDQSSGFFDSAPEIQSLALADEVDGFTQLGRFTMRGFTVRGAFRLPVPGYQGFDWHLVRLETCRFDSGLTQPPAIGGGPGYRFETLVVRGNTIRGNATLVAAYVDFTHNAVIRGDVVVRSEGTHVVRSNYWHDAPGVALTTGSLGPIELTGNVIEGAGTGIHFQHWDGGEIARNVVRNVSGNGFETGVGTGFTLVDNEASNCGGDGFHILPDAGYGTVMMHRNRALDCVGDGIESGLTSPLSNEARFVHNVVGRCGGTGIKANGVIRNNTVFGCGGAGIAVAGNAAVERNIAFQNAGYGLVLVDEAVVDLDCNDWFGNATGATQGVAPAPSDLSIDPVFCDIANGDVHLMQGSPLLSAPGCGLIGADTLGCVDGTTDTVTPGVPPTVQPTSRELELYAPIPNPARMGTRISFSLPEAADVSLKVMDIQGREVCSLAKGRMEAGAHEVRWRGAWPGAFFVTLDAGGRRMVRRLEVLR